LVVLTPKLPLLPLWEKGVGGMRAKMHGNAANRASRRSGAQHAVGRSTQWGAARSGAQHAVGRSTQWGAARSGAQHAVGRSTLCPYRRMIISNNRLR